MNIRAIIGTSTLIVGILAGSSASALPMLEKPFGPKPHFSSWLSSKHGSMEKKVPFYPAGPEFKHHWDDSARHPGKTKLPGKLLKIHPAEVADRHSGDDKRWLRDEISGFPEHLPFCKDDVKRPADVPEPATIMLLGLGLLGLGFCRRFTRQ